MTRRDAIVIAGAVLLGLAGCAGSGGGPPEQGGVAPVAVAEPPGLELPCPAELAGAVDAPRRAAYAEEDLISHGKDYEHALPANRLIAAGDAVTFAAEWEPATGMAGAAYGIYSFAVAGFDREDVIEFGWDTPPPEADRLFIGLSDWDRNTWHWRGYADGGQISVDALADYFSSGDVLLLVVVSIGYNQDCTLRWVHLGTMPAAVAQLDVSAEDGVAPVVLSLVGYNSDPGVGEVVNFEWDFEGDGTYDSQGELDFEVHTYGSEGEYTPQLRITTDYGLQATDSASLSVVNGWEHCWGGDSYDEAKACAVVGSAVYLAGRTSSSFSTGLSDALLLSYGLDGSFNWAKAWGSDESDTIFDMAADSSGNLYTVGNTQGFELPDKSLCLMKWDLDGNPVWAKAWYNEDAHDWEDLDVLEDAVYVLGTSQAAANNAILARFELDGGFLWAKHFGSVASESAVDLAAVHPAGEGVQLHTVSRFGDAPERGVLYCRLSGEGNLEQAGLWTSTGDDLWPEAIHVDNGTGRVFVVGANLNGQHEVFLLNYSAGTGSGRAFAAGDSSFPYALAVIPVGGNLVVAGKTNQDGLLMSITTNGNLLAAVNNPGIVSTFSIQALFLPYDSGVLAAGHGGTITSSSWTDVSMTARTLEGSWSGQTISVVEPEGSSHTLTGATLTTISDGVHDTGSDEDELYVGLLPVP